MKHTSQIDTFCMYSNQPVTSTDTWYKDISDVERDRERERERENFDHRIELCKVGRIINRYAATMLSVLRQAVQRQTVLWV